MEIKIEHVFYILIVILFVVLMNNYAIEGVENLNLEYVNKKTSEESIEYCSNIPQSWQNWRDCLSKFYYNTDTNQIEACVGYMIDVDEHYWIACDSKHNGDYYSDDSKITIDKFLTCKKADHNDLDTYQSCPNCDDNSFYSLDGNPCTDNLDICNSCLKSDTISWNNPESKERIIPVPIYGTPRESNISYKGPNPLKDCSNTTKFCSQQQSDCFSDIRVGIDAIKGDSSETCSNQSILEKIEKRKITSDKCKYDKVQIYAEDEWLKDFLEVDGYCDPTDTTWRCKRGLPEYCKNKDDCEYDMNAYKCICKPPLEMLQNDTCGIPNCGPINDGLCRAGKICQRSIVPGPTGGGTTTYSCVDK